MKHPETCCQHQHSPKQDKDANTRVSVTGLYTCPMHLQIVQDHPGSCPICGMALEPTTASAHDDTEYRDMLKRFLVSLILTIPIVIMSMGQIPGTHWFQFALSTPVVIWGGWPFFTKAWQSLVTRNLNMFTLIGLGIGTAYLYSAIAVLFPGIFPTSFHEKSGMAIYFEAAAVITVLVLLGQVLELKARSRTGLAIQALMEQSPKTARRVTREHEEDILIDEVLLGDHLRVRPGEKVPVDGIVDKGLTTIDESMVTGESAPVAKNPGDSVTAGTINQNGSIVIRAERIGSETLLARIIQLVAQAQRTRAPIQKLADSVASYFVPIVIAIAVLTFFAWGFFGPEPSFAHGLVNAVAVLIIACPCALGLATPMSIIVGMGRGAQMGVLIRNAEAIEQLEKVNTVVIDKTGTLTEGRPQMMDILTIQPWSPASVLKLVASIELGSEHPLGAALVAAAKEHHPILPKADSFQFIAGAGVKGEVEGHAVIVGTEKFLQSYEIQGLLPLREHADRHHARGHTTLFVGIDHKAAAVLSVSDPIKESTPAAIEQLHRLGMRVIMLTGDTTDTAEAVAEILEIDEVFAGVQPKDKYELVQKLKSEKCVVAMAGDGVNDAPALAAADVGIAMGTGTDVAIESAAITLMKGDLYGIVRAITLSRAIMSNIRQNLFLAFIYNIVSIPIAAGILFPWFGILLSPMIASAAMSLSSVSVILNALRLKRVARRSRA